MSIWICLKKTKRKKRSRKLLRLLNNGYFFFLFFSRFPSSCKQHYALSHITIRLVAFNLYMFAYRIGKSKKKSRRKKKSMQSNGWCCARSLKWLVFRWSQFFYSFRFNFFFLRFRSIVVICCYFTRFIPNAY